MPTYEYVCEACGHKFERFQSMTAKPISRCPECKGKVRKLISGGGGFIFKGGGFYETDYRSSAYKEKAAAEKKEKSGEKKAETGKKLDATPKPKADTPKTKDK